MAAAPPIIASDPEILGGAPLFAGTRVPLRALLDYLEGGDSLEEFLEDFPSVTREHAEVVLSLTKFGPWLRPSTIR